MSRAMQKRMLKIDLHVHTREYSPCGRSSIAEQVEAAVAAGLDAIVFADHDHLFPLAALKRLNAEYAPFRIFSGIEISVSGGEHILVLGVHDTLLEQRTWHYSDLYEFVHEHDGFLALNHPYRFNQQIEIEHEAFPPDAVEAFSNNITPALRRRIRHLADTLHVPVLSNSDGHHFSEIGRYYNRLNNVPADEHELIVMLKSGKFQCVAPDLLEA